MAVNTPTEEESADAPSAAAEVATAVAATVAKTVKETLNTNDTNAQRVGRFGAVAKRVAAHVVAALLNATLGDQTEKNESDTTTVEAAADHSVAVESTPRLASPPATPPTPACHATRCDRRVAPVASRAAGKLDSAGDRTGQ